MLFEIKLEELEQHYVEMKKRIDLSESKNQEALALELLKMKRVYQKNENVLSDCVKSGCLPTVSSLALAQLSYCHQTESILKEQLAFGSAHV